MCQTCQLSKNHALTFCIYYTHAIMPLHLVRYNLWTSHKHSSNGYNYYINFINDFLNFTWVYFLENKLGAYQAFLDFKIQAKFQTSFKIKTLQ